MQRQEYENGKKKIPLPEVNWCQLSNENHSFSDRLTGLRQAYNTISRSLLRFVSVTQAGCINCNFIENIFRQYVI